MTDAQKSEQYKEVYAYAGLALYAAQCLEKSLENFLCLHGRISGECVTLADLDALEDRVESQTVGRLLHATRSRVQFDNGAEKLLTTALDRRNFLAHRFFKERAIDFLSKAGRAKMISELTQLRERFDEADMVASVICKALQEELGVSDEVIERAYKRMVPQEDA
jgi:hypothetical protein